MNLRDLRTGIYSVGNTVSGSNGFFYAQAPDNVTYPYTVYHIIDDTYTRLSVGSITDSVLINFSIFDKRITAKGNKVSSATIEDVANEIITKFDNANINVSGYGNLNFVRQYMSPSIVEEGNYWSINIRYSLLITK